MSATPANESALVRMTLSSAVEIVIVGDAALPDGIEALPTAPRRWLWLNADADARAAVVASDAIVVDVDGKWTVFSCAGPSARRALAAAVDVDTVLEPRGCAALMLFDCPAVLARQGQDGFVACVHTSYAASFEAAYAEALNA